jgi:hypothetical protein
MHTKSRAISKVGFFFSITTQAEPQVGATEANLSLQELNILIEQKRKEVISNSRASSVYLYNKDLTVLYYTAPSQNALRLELGIVLGTIGNCIRTGSLFLCASYLF